MRILIVKDFVQDAESIKKIILSNYPLAESVLVCQSPVEAIDQVKMYGTHVIVLNLEKEDVPHFLEKVKEHPHRIINTAKNSYQDYFATRLLGLNDQDSPEINTPLSAASYVRHLPSLNV